MIKITKAGWIYVILTVFLGIAAANTGNNLIYMIVSAMLAFMGISGIIGKINLSKIDVSLSLPEHIFAEETFPVCISIRNRKRFLPLFLIRVYINNSSVLIPYVDRKGKTEKILYMYIKDRGIHKVEKIKVCSVFPFNFFKRCVFKKVNREFIVYPSPKKCKYQENLYLKRKKGYSTSQKKGYEGELISIKEYSYGDPLKYIHWKASAKTDSLKTKELSSEMSSPVILDINSIPGNLEYKLSCLTYMVLKLYKSMIPFGLRINGKFLKPKHSEKHKRIILRELALYGKNKN